MPRNGGQESLGAGSVGKAPANVNNRVQIPSTHVTSQGCSGCDGGTGKIGELLQLVGGCVGQSKQNKITAKGW